MPSSSSSRHSTHNPVVCSREHTAGLLDFRRLTDAIRHAAGELARGEIISPGRMVVPMGEGGVMLSMPATARDIGIHKLVNVQTANASQGLPTIHSTVTVCDAVTGRVLCLLDGPEVTGRRTAAVSMLGIQTLLPHFPRKILLIGTGVQARYHVQAIHALFPECDIRVRGTSISSAEYFCRQNIGQHNRLYPDHTETEEDVDVVLMVTTSTEPVYNRNAVAGRLVVGVGAFKPDMAEIGHITLEGSTIYADEPEGARHEAGDLIRAGIDWSDVRSLAEALQYPPSADQPVVFKSVGTAAWDLAAARVALASLHQDAAE